MKCISCDCRLTAANVSSQSADTCAECAKSIVWEPSKPETELDADAAGKALSDAYEKLMARLG